MGDSSSRKMASFDAYVWAGYDAATADELVYIASGCPDWAWSPLGGEAQNPKRPGLLRFAGYVGIFNTTDGVCYAEGYKKGYNPDNVDEYKAFVGAIDKKAIDDLSFLWWDGKSDNWTSEEEFTGRVMGMDPSSYQNAAPPGGKYYDVGALSGDNHLGKAKRLSVDLLCDGSDGGAKCTDCAIYNLSSGKKRLILCHTCFTVTICILDLSKPTDSNGEANGSEGDLNRALANFMHKGESCPATWG